MKIIRIIDSRHVNIEDKKLNGCEETNDIETTSGNDVNFYDKTEPQSVIYGLSTNVNRCSNKILEIEFNKEGTPYHGLLIIPLILVVILVNLGYLLIPKYDANALDYFDLFLQEMTYILNVLILLIASHHFSYLLIIGKGDVCSAKKLFYLFLGCFCVLLTYRYTAITLKFRCFLPEKLTQLLAFLVQQVTLFTLLWFQHPKSQRSDPCFQSRYKWFITFRVLNTIGAQVYIQAARLFDSIINHFQIALAFLLLGIRYISLKLSTKLMEKARGDSLLSASFDVSSRVGCYHALYLMIIIGSKARFETTIVYTIVDTLLIVRSFSKIVSLVNDQRRDNRIQFNNALQMITIREMLEIVLPFCFCLIYIIAFFGPNKEAFGFLEGISRDEMLWTVTKISIVIFFDGTRIVICAIILESRYHVSIFKSYCHLMNVYWKHVTALISFLLCLVSLRIPFLRYLAT